ncbi:MAG: hypothetical protein ACXABJ_08705, partial [Candidatus Heimdallarchaeaceae archaeon]
FFSWNLDFYQSMRRRNKIFEYTNNLSHLLDTNSFYNHDGVYEKVLKSYSMAEITIKCSN